MYKVARISAFAVIIVLFSRISINGQLPLEKIPENIGMSTERLERINYFIEDFVNQNKLAGVVALIARHGKIVYRNNFGLMDIETNSPIECNTIFRLASMSKPIISVGAMILYEKGFFQLDDPVSKYIPEFKNLKVLSGKENKIPIREMTIQDLLRHTSGLSYGFDNNYVDSLYRVLNVEDEKNTLKEMIKKLAQVPLLNEPGEKWNYSFSTDVLGYLIEVISDKSLDEFLSENIFNPLKMEDTGFFIPKTKLSRLMTLYQLSKDGRLIPVKNENKLKYSKKPNFLSGGGGLLSTPFDYLLFSQMLLNKGELNGTRILSPKTVELMCMNHVPDVAMPISMNFPPLEFLLKGHGFGLGFRVLTNKTESGSLANVGAFGWFGAYDTYFYIDPKEELIGILMTQYQGLPYYPLVREFQVLMYQAIIN